MQEEYPTVKLIRETRMISSGRRRCGNHLVPKGEAFTETVALVDGQMTTDILCDRCRYDYMP
jgi:hypothetical protein